MPSQNGRPGFKSMTSNNFLRGQSVDFLIAFLALRERSFLILGTGAEDFWQGYETFSHYFVGVREYYEQFLWGTKLISLKNFG